MQLYRHSGTMPLTGIPIVVVFGTVAAVVLGFVYSFATVYCPIVYVNFLLTAGLGLGIGWTVAKGCLIGKIRNVYVAGAYGLAFGAVGMYVAWAADLIARVGVQGGAFAGNGLELALEAFKPAVLWGYIQIFYEKGFWSISQHGNGGGAVNGVFLAVVWMIEGGAVLIASTVYAYRKNAAVPFCENCNRWTVMEKAIRRLLPLGPEADSVDKAIAGDVNALVELPYAVGEPPTYLELDLSSCPACQESHFLSIQLVRHTLDKKGNDQVKKDTVLNHLVLNPADVPRVREAGRDWEELAPEQSAQVQEAESEPPPPSTDQPPQEGKNDFFNFLGNQ